MSSRVLAILLVVPLAGGAACRALLDNDELTFGDGGGGATVGGGGTSSGGTAGESPGGGGGENLGGGGAGGEDCCAAADVPVCACGCPSLLSNGAFESADAVALRDFDCSDMQTFVEDGGCGAIRFSEGSSTSCALQPVITSVSLEGMCLFGRFRARSSAGTGANITLEVHDASGAFIEAATGSVDVDWVEVSRPCKVSTAFDVTKLFINFNTGDDAAVADIDFIEIFVGPCGGEELDCTVTPSGS